MSLHECQCKLIAIACTFKLRTVQKFPLMSQPCHMRRFGFGVPEWCLIAHFIATPPLNLHLCLSSSVLSMSGCLKINSDRISISAEPCMKRFISRQLAWPYLGAILWSRDYNSIHFIFIFIASVTIKIVTEIQGLTPHQEATEVRKKLIFNRKKP